MKNILEEMIKFYGIVDEGDIVDEADLEGEEEIEPKAEVKYGRGI